MTADGRLSAWALAGLLAVLGLMAYGNTLNGGWVWDDASSVLLHKHVQDPAQFFQLFKEDQHAFGRGQGNFYRPLVSASFMLDYWLSYNPEKDAAPDLPYPGVKPLLFHLTSTAWHIAAAFFLALLLGRLGAPGWVQVATACVWVLHPLHTEAVAYISGRADMMSGTFMFAGLNLALSNAKGRAGIAAGIGAVLCFVLGVLSKEATFIFPVLLLLCLLLRDNARDVETPFWERLGPLAFVGSAAALVVYGLLRVSVLQFAKGGGGGAAAPFLQRLVETLQAFAWYLQLLFWPTHLHMERTLEGATGMTAILGGIALLALGGGAVLAWRTGHRRITLGIAWFLVTWLPISGIFPLNAPMAEHWLYVPMAGFWWAVFEVLALLTPAPSARWVATAATAALALVLLHATIVRNEDWGSNERLFEATLRENPNTERVAYNLAVTYSDLDKDPSAARRVYEQLEALYARKPLPGGAPREDEPDVWYSHGSQLMKQGDYSGAIGQLSKLVPLSKDPKQADLAALALLGIGQCSLALGDPVQADRAFRGATQLKPELRGLAASISDGGAVFPK